MVGRYGAGLEGLFDRHLTEVEEGAQTPAAGEQQAARQDRRRLA
jgi:hypothetical protein